MQHQTKRNFASFLVSRKKPNKREKKVLFGFVFRETKKISEIGNPREKLMGMGWKNMCGGKKFLRLPGRKCPITGFSSKVHSMQKKGVLCGVL
jgi:hypothetical protein